MVEEASWKKGHVASELLPTETQECWVEVVVGGMFQAQSCKGPEGRQTARSSLYPKRVRLGVGVGGQGEEMALGSAGTRLRDKVTGCKSQEPSASESLLGSW